MNPWLQVGLLALPTVGPFVVVAAVALGNGSDREKNFALFVLWGLLLPVMAVYGALFGWSELGCLNALQRGLDLSFCMGTLGENSQGSNISPEVFVLTAGPIILLLVPALAGLLLGRRRLVGISVCVAVAIADLGFAIAQVVAQPGLWHQLGL